MSRGVLETERKRLVGLGLRLPGAKQGNTWRGTTHNRLGFTLNPARAGGWRLRVFDRTRTVTVRLGVNVNPELRNEVFETLDVAIAVLALEYGGIRPANRHAGGQR